VAYVIGAYNVGLLAAPLLGSFAERRQMHKPLFFSGFAALGCVLTALPVASGVGLWVLLTLLIGLGTAASATVAILFIVDFVPQREWDLRIGWLQSFYGAGQVCGLLLAAMCGSTHVTTGLWVAAACAATALLLGRIGLPAGKMLSSSPVGMFGEQRLAGFATTVSPEPAAGGLLRHSHHLYWAGLRRVPEIIGTRFAHFLSSWFAYNFGVAAFFAYYPLLMRHTFNVAPRITALVYSMTAGLGIGLFILAGRVATRHGSGSVYLGGLLLRAAGFALLSVALLLALQNRAVIAICGFALVMLAWPLLSVSGTGLAARLTALGEGAAMGLMNAIGALATVIGTFLGGPLVQWMGYNAVLALSLIGLGVAVVLGGQATITDRRRGRQAP